MLLYIVVLLEFIYIYIIIIIIIIINEYLTSIHLYTLPHHSQLVQAITLVNKDLATWMKTTVLHVTPRLSKPHN